MIKKNTILKRQVLKNFKEYYIMVEEIKEKIEIFFYF